MRPLTISALASLLLTPAVTLAADNTALQKQIDELRAQLDATASMLESQTKSSANSANHLGGYGEMHYNNFDSGNEIDYHRFVLFIGHDYSDKIRFYSELEVEHSLAGDGKPGEVELEQAFVEMDLGSSHSIKGGMFLIPVGIINETHEPPTFYGVERNPVEGNIIPATWWEGGAMLSGRFGQAISYDVALHSGLMTGADDDYAIRKGRQKVAEANANDPAVTARIRWQGVSPVALGATVHYQSDITQSADATAGSATLMEAHAIAQFGPFALKALYAGWNLSGDGPKALGADAQRGWYVEPSYKITSSWGVFARYSAWDNKAGDSADSEVTQSNGGVSYWPHANVALKADYMMKDGASKDEGVSLGIGYHF